VALEEADVVKQRASHLFFKARRVAAFRAFDLSLEWFDLIVVSFQDCRYCMVLHTKERLRQVDCVCNELDIDTMPSLWIGAFLVFLIFSFSTVGPSAIGAVEENYGDECSS